MSIIKALKMEERVPVVLADRNGIITYVNQCFFNCYGWTDDLIGSSLTRIIPSHFQDSHNMGFSRFLVTGRSRIAAHPMKAPVQRGDGGLTMSEHLIVVEKSRDKWIIGARLTPLYQDADLVETLQATHGLRVAPLDELRTTMGKMEMALGEVEDAIVWTDQHGIVNWCNGAFDRLTGIPHLEIIGSSLANILPLKRAGRPVETDQYPLARALDNDCTHTEYTLDRTGPPMVLEINGAPFSMTTVERYVILAMRDVTRRKQMEDTLRASRKQMEDELKVAHDIQMSLLPRRYPKRPEIDLYAAIQPAREVGGDFYDFYFINPSHLSISVGDVSGKGVPAALFMAMTKTLVRNRVQGRTHTADVIQQANRIMCADNPSHMFVSLFLAALNIHTGQLTYTNAGHNPPLLKRADGTVIRVDHRHGPVMGVSPESRYAEGVLTLSDGDTLMIYTDGITEAMDAKHRFFSEGRLTHLLTDLDDQSPEPLVQEVLNAVHSFQVGVPPADDLTLLSLQYHGKPFNYEI